MCKHTGFYLCHLLYVWKHYQSTFQKLVRATEYSENKIHVFEVASTVLFVRDLQLNRDTGANSKFRLHNESLHKPEVADYKINRLIIPSLLWILWKLKREENKDMKVTMRNNRQSFWHLYC